MATVKVKYRPSSVDTKEGIIYYQIIHKRVARQSKTGYHLFKDEWDDETQTVKTVNGKRSAHLHSIKEAISCDIMRINAIITKLDSGSKDYTADDIVNQFNERKEDYSFFIFMQGIIDQHRKLGKIRTAETYTSSMNSFKKFVRHYSSLNNDHISEEIFISEIDSYTISTYESYLKQQGLSPNTTSFYMRNLRAVYNRAIESQLSLQQHPFKHVYTGVEKTIKRAVTLNTIRKIRDLNLTTNPRLDFARDMFLFSFYTRGMSFIDMAYLRKKDLNKGILTYRRHKTGQQLFIKWEKCMAEIINKYNIAQSPYLLPIIGPHKEFDERKQYIYEAHNINRYLKIIGRRIGLHKPLTMYVARHAWASIARSKNIPISIISEGMGHDSETTTRIYLASLDNMAVDKANSRILKAL